MFVFFLFFADILSVMALQSNDCEIMWLASLREYDVEIIQ